MFLNFVLLVVSKNKVVGQLGETRSSFPRKKYTNFVVVRVFRSKIEHLSFIHSFIHSKITLEISNTVEQFDICSHFSFGHRQLSRKIQYVEFFRLNIFDFM